MGNAKETLHPRDVVSAYAELLAVINEGGEFKPLSLIPSALPESLLPYPLTTIRHALGVFLLHQDYIERRDAIEDAYTFLDNFIPDEEYNLFTSLQNSMSGNNPPDQSAVLGELSIADITGYLRHRTKTLKKRRKQSLQELRSLRRIIGLSDDITETEDREFAEPELNLQV